MTKINIELNSLIYANAEVYYEASTNYFVYKGPLLSGDSIDIDVSYNSPVWILVIPTSNSAYVSVTGTPSGPSNYSSSDSNQMLVAIIVPTVLGGTLLIIVIIIVVIWLMNRRIRMLHNQNNAATSTNYTLNYSQNNQEKYNEKYMSYYPVKMGALQFPYPPHPSKRESIYMIKSIPRKYSDTRTCYSNDPATERSTNGSRRVSTFKKQ